MMSVKKEIPKKTNKAKENKAKVKKRNNTIIATSQAQLKLIDEMQKKLPEYIENRKMKFIEALKEYDIVEFGEDETVLLDNKLFPLSEIITYSFEPIAKIASSIPTYTPDNLSIMFDFYKYCTVELNKIKPYAPTKEDFCRLLGISTNRFKDLKNSNSMEMREVCLQLEDYISSFLTQSAIQGGTEQNYTIFIQKASLGRRDSDPIQLNNNVQHNTILSDQALIDKMNKYKDILK